MSADPHGEYTRRLERRRREAGRYEVEYRRVAWARLGVALSFLLLIWITLSREALSPWWLVAPPLVFVALMMVHVRVDRKRRRVAEAVRYYERGLGRIEDRWAGSGVGGEEYLDTGHLYAADLDLFGPGSVFELLSVCRTKAGERILADWLMQPASAEEIGARQEAVGELGIRLDLREDLSTLGAGLESAIHIDRISEWAARPRVLRGQWLGVIVWGMPALVIGLLVHAIVTGSGSLFYPVLALEGAVVFWFRARVAGVLGAVDLPVQELDLVSSLIARLENEAFSAARLERLARRFEARGGGVSSEIRRLVDVVQRFRSLKSGDAPITIIVFLTAFLIAPFSIVLMLDLRAALEIERWRERHGGDVRKWLLAIGEFEALASLGGYAYEHPSDPFPEIVNGPDSEFRGEALAHPLLACAAAVPNTVMLDSDVCMLVVSGSNMSGKSTLLRTVGVNAVLALAGGPVRARRLRISPVRIGATLRIQDSLREGTSRFYSEIVRLRDIMDLATHDEPVLFLLDEILHGTNSHDRAVGAAGIVRGLVARGAIGLVTTHDLALAAIAEEPGLRAANVHFEDRVEDGRMVFDYRMKPGVIRKSNALELMRSIGLDLD